MADARRAVILALFFGFSVIVADGCQARQRSRPRGSCCLGKVAAASCEAPDGATVSFQPEAIIKRPPHERAEYAVAFKAKTVLRVRPLPCLPPYAGYLHNVHAGYWFNRRGWHEWPHQPTGLCLKRRMISLSMGSCTVSAACLIESHLTSRCSFSGHCLL
jgi:hypothetical protein